MTKLIFEDPIIWTDAYGTLAKLDRSTYPNGEPLVKEENPPETILLRPRDISDLMTALFWVDSLIFRGEDTPNLILPYVFGSRQDRLNNTGDQLFTLKSIAEIINYRGFPSVTILDPHSDVTPALLENCNVLSQLDLISMYKDKIQSSPWQAVVAPDAGASKKASQIANALGIPLIHGWKVRDLKAGILSGFGIEPITDESIMHVGVVDDLCDAGGTFLGLADCLAKANLTADLYITHGYFSKGTYELLKKYVKISCTDSVLAHHRTDINVLPICETLINGGANESDHVNRRV